MDRSVGRGVFMREAGAWTSPIVNLAHILGIGALFGSILVLDLALIGVWGRGALPALAAAVAPVAAAGFLFAAASGIGLLSTNATEYEGNPFFLIKFLAIAVGLINAALIQVLKVLKVLRVLKGSGAAGASVLGSGEPRAP